MTWIILFVILLNVLVVGYLIWNNLKLSGELSKIKNRNPTELDLELATLGQILDEIKKRPIRYLIIFPKFKINEEEDVVGLDSMAIEGSGMPAEVAEDVVRAAADMMEQNRGTFNTYEE
jgi:hypothetical protein